MPSDDSRPLIWILTHGKTGDLNQALALAEALDWAYEIKMLALRSRLKGGVFGASLVNIDRSGSSALVPPWPDVVISVESRAVPAARWIRRRAGPGCRLVHIGRPAAPLDAFDLIITFPQFRMPRRSNIVELSTPFHLADEKRMAEGRRRIEPEIAHLPHPRIAVLVGGVSNPYRMDEEAAVTMARDVSAMAAERGGSLLVTTSRRTPPKASAALLGALTVPHHGFAWPGEGAENPYFGYLAVADEIVVTPDSVSMLIEACSTGRPVWLYDLPARPSVMDAAVRHLYEAAYFGRHAHVLGPIRALFDAGLLEMRADRPGLHMKLIAEGKIAAFGELRPENPGLVSCDLDAAAEALRALVGGGSGAVQEPRGASDSSQGALLRR